MLEEMDAVELKLGGRVSPSMVSVQIGGCGGSVLVVAAVRRVPIIISERCGEYDIFLPGCLAGWLVRWWSCHGEAGERGLEQRRALRKHKVWREGLPGTQSALLSLWNPACEHCRRLPDAVLMHWQLQSGRTF